MSLSGIEALLEMEIYDSAFPLHEVRRVFTLKYISVVVSLLTDLSGFEI